MSTLMQSAATIAAVIGVVKTARLYVKYEETKEEKRKEEAFNLYVETGKKEQAFYSLDRYVAKTAERKRSNRVKEKAIDRREFSAWCECPNCDALDVHMIEKVNSIWLVWPTGNRKNICKRRCKNCGLAWKQR